MSRNKVNYALIENESKRKVSYQKRQKSLLKKSEELQTLCDVEVAVIIYGPYKNEPVIFPNIDAVRNTFMKFKELLASDKPKSVVTTEQFTKQMIKKLVQKLQKVKKENRVREITNEMYEVLSGKNVSTEMHPYDLNDLSCVIKRNLKRVRELINKKADEEGSTSNAPRPIVEPTVTNRTNLGGTRDPSPILFSQTYPPMVSQFFSPMPQQTAIVEEPGISPPMPSTIMDSPIPSPLMDPSTYSPVYPPVTHQMEPSTTIPPIDVSTPINNNQNNSNDVPHSPSFSQLFNWNDDVMTLLDDPFFKNNNVQDPSNNNNS